MAKPSWEYACRHKRVYLSFTQARKIIKRMLREKKHKPDPVDRRKLEPYSCPYCGRFHVGHELVKRKGDKPVSTSDFKVYKPTVIFDIDGTLSDPEHRRHHAYAKNWEEFFKTMDQDPPILPVIKVLHAMQQAGNYIVLATGRPERYRFQTSEWLRSHGVSVYNKLYMRGNDDRRPDYKVKSDILEQIKDDGYSPFLVIDDRQQVVDMWRERGLVVLQNKPFDEAPTAAEAELLLQPDRVKLQKMLNDGKRHFALDFERHHQENGAIYGIMFSKTVENSKLLYDEFAEALIQFGFNASSSQRRFSHPDGTILLMRAADSEVSVNKYWGHEYQWMGIECPNSLPENTLKEIDRLKAARLRSPLNQQLKFVTTPY